MICETTATSCKWHVNKHDAEFVDMDLDSLDGQVNFVLKKIRMLTPASLFQTKSNLKKADVSHNG